MVKKNSARAWVLASRPKTLTAAVIPVMIGSGLAFSDGRFVPLAALLCLLFACLMQIAANLINDLFDYLKGSDRADRLGPERAMAQGWISERAMRGGIAITIALACAAGCGLIFYGGWTLVGVGAVCVVFAFLYTWILSYKGFGDVLVLVFFGFVGVGGTYYVQALNISWDVLAASLACGIVINTLLVVNNYRDRDQDRQSGKMTLVVRLGERFGAYFYLWLGIVAVAACLPLAAGGKYLPAFLPLLYLVPHVVTWKKMTAIGSGKQLNEILGQTSRNMLIFGVLLSTGLIAEAYL